MRNSPTQLVGCCMIAVLLVGGLVTARGESDASEPVKAAGKESTLQRGAAIYTRQCAECHGEKGQGVEGAYEKPLAGDRSLKWLTSRIERTMPEGEAKKCVGEDAAAVAAYLYENFYSAKAHETGGKTAGRTLQRLTVEQHRQSLADLIGSFRETQPPSEQRGLWTQVYPSRGMKQADKPLSEEVSGTLDAKYTPEHPLHEKFDTKGHSVRWSGSLLASETGEYEIVVRTDQAMRLWLNDGRAVGGGIGNEITDTKDIALLDGWLQSENKTEFRAKVFLLAGRAYPIMLEFSAHTQGVGNKDWHKNQKARNSYISLRWVPPGGVEQVIPQRHLAPQRTAEVFIADNVFPADDASMGFISGAGVSKAWLDAATHAAIDTAGYVLDHLDQLSGSKPDAPDRRERVIAFCNDFVSRAFRRPLSEDEKRRHVTGYFEGKDTEPALKQAVLAALLSPRFLYPQAGLAKPDTYDTATALALAMWDSIPDQALREAAAKNQLATTEQIESQTHRMLDDPRAQAKLMRFFHHWLELERAEYVDKDKQLFPEFDEHLLADLRTSLDLYLEHVVFSHKSDYRELLLADYLFVNDRLAEVYGIDRGQANGQGFTQTAVETEQRSGVITHPYLLTAFAYHNSTSPIHRGVFLTRNIIGRPLNPPPNAIAFDGADFDPNLTMREKVTAFTRDSACMACHETINPLGFSLEHYDSIGRWRAKDKDKPINAESDFPDEDGKTLKLKGARDVAEYAIASDASHRTFVRLLFQHVAQRDPSAVSPDTLDRLTTRFKANNYHIRELFVQIAVEMARQGLELGKPKEKP